MDCSQTAEDDIRYMLWGMENEGLTAMLNYMNEENINVRKHMVEFMQYEPHLIGRGVEIDLDGQSSVPGLYAVGDLVGNFRADISGAAVFGWIAGAAAAERAKKMKGFHPAERSPTVSERADFYSEIVIRRHGPDWKEANLALQQIMNEYAGVKVRSETLLNAGLKYLSDLRKKTLRTIKADNSHELMRCLEVVDLLDCGEMIFHAALERKETRAMHRRSDYPFTNPLLADKFLTIRLEKGKPVLEWRDRR